MLSQIKQYEDINADISDRNVRLVGVISD